MGPAERRSVDHEHGKKMREPSDPPSQDIDKIALGWLDPWARPHCSATRH
jgi:hypothetical protein